MIFNIIGVSTSKLMINGKQYFNYFDFKSTFKYDRKNNCKLSFLELINMYRNCYKNYNNIEILGNGNIAINHNTFKYFKKESNVFIYFFFNVFTI